MRRLRRLVALVAVPVAAAALLVGGAATASAHATLEATNPAQGAVVATAPGTVSATFDESVGVSQDSLRVFGPNGDRVDDGRTTQGAQADVIVISLRGGLGNGTYTVAWHVVSADSHPVQGAFTFSIGAPSATSVNAATLGRGAGAAVGLLYGVARWLSFAAYAVLVGAVAFLIVCWPTGAGRRSVLRLVTGGWAGLIVASLGTLLLQGAYGGGLPLGQVFSSGVIRATLASRLGEALQARVLLLAVAAVALGLGLPRLVRASGRARVVLGAGWAVLAAGLAATWSSADHSSVGMQPPLALAADMVHLVAMAVWLGGIAVLAGVLLRGDDPDDARTAVPRFSQVAFGCVVAMVVTGTYQAWRDVGSIAALTATTYGRLVLLKVAGILVLIGLGYLARLRIRQGRRASADAEDSADAPAEPASLAARGRATGKAASTRNRKIPPAASLASSGLHHPGRRVGRVGRGEPPPDTTFRRLRQSVAVEAVVGAAVLAVAALLVETPTGREAYAPITDVTESFNTGGPGGSGTIEVVVTPARLGTNQVHMYLLNSWRYPYSPAEVDVSLSLPARQLGPANLTVVPNGPGHFLTDPSTITFTGTWRLTVTIRSDAFDETTLSIPVSIH